jgi:hypothetical protein
MKQPEGVEKLVRLVLCGIGSTSYRIRRDQLLVVLLDKLPGTSASGITNPSAERPLCCVYEFAPLGWKAPQASGSDCFGFKAAMLAGPLVLASLRALPKV